MDVQGPCEFMTMEEVVDDAISQLDDPMIDEVRHHPSSTDMHFGLGLWIRNEYIHSGKMGPVLMADDVSSEITEEIAKKVLPEYDGFPLAVELFSGWRNAYTSAHRYYIDRDVSKMINAVRTHYDALAAAQAEFDAVRKEVDWPFGEREEVWMAACDRYGKAKDRFMEHVIDDLFDRKPIEDLMERDDATIAAHLEELLELRTYSISDENMIRSFFVPAELAYLADPSLKGSDEWEAARSALLWLLDEISFYPEEVPLPSWFFDDDEIGALLADVKVHGDRFSLIGMSKRIKEKYMTQEELERWGDVNAMGGCVCG